MRLPGAPWPLSPATDGPVSAPASSEADPTDHPAPPAAEAAGAGRRDRTMLRADVESLLTPRHSVLRAYLSRQWADDEPPAKPDLPTRIARTWRSAARWLAGDVPPWKRAMDLGGALILGVLLSPLLAVVALAIKLNDGGAVLFWQTRVGRRGREFSFPKFRSMVVGADKLRQKLLVFNEHDCGITFKIKKDPRITWIGRIIRKLSIDELPQLWCIVKGDMTLVGPRPPLPGEVTYYTVADYRRLEVAPGLTCIWQVSGRGDLPFPQQVAMDVEYIENRSLWLDLKLLALTVPAVLWGKGAY
jgi:lipopolysaccharide/colanic/teichoic acid biosynthesis glycosyltransferase